MYDKVATALGGGRVNDAPTPFTPFDETRHALDRAQELSSRVCALADRLVGARPPSTGPANGKGELSNSLFQAMRAHADQTKEMIDRANDALTVIEQNIP